MKKPTPAAAVDPFDLPIEEQVLALSDLPTGDPPPCFQQVLDKVAAPLTVAKTSLKLLHAFSSPDVTAEKVTEALEANPYYEHQVLRMVLSLGRKDLPNTEGAVVLLGMQNTRNLVLALQLLRSVNGAHPEWDPNGKPLFDPKKVLKYALKAEEFLIAKKLPDAELGFAAGMLFDYLHQLAEHTSLDAKVAQAFLEHIFNHGLRCAQIGAELAKQIPKFKFSKYAFSACLLHDIGKVAMGIVEPEYQKFLDACATKEVPRKLRYYAEKKKFGVLHPLIGAQICRLSGIFEPAATAVLRHHDPDRIRGNRAEFELAGLVSIATRMAVRFKKVQDGSDPMVAEWMGPELKGFPLEARHLVAATAAIHF